MRVGQLELDLEDSSSNDRRSGRRNQVLADINLVAGVVGDLGHEPPVTLEAMDIASCKFFDRAFLEPFSEFLRQAPSRVAAVYDEKARGLLQDCVGAARTWHEDLGHHIGPPEGNDPNHHDYLVFRPPEGPWGDDRGRAWQAYYAYVTDKERQLGDVIRALAALDHRLYELKVEVGMPTVPPVAAPR